MELIPFSPQSKHVILFTTEEADQLLHDSITAGHLLLGILRHGTSAAADTLSRSGLTLGSVREALRRSKGAVEHAFVYVIEDITPALLKSLKENPEHLHDVTPEKFEHLAADRLVRMGFDVMLTGATNRKDGGVDIIAAKRDPAVGNFLIAAQVKHHRGSQKVRREDVDRLISLKGGIFSFGLLVTNTTFTQDAKWVAAQHNKEHFARLRDFEDVKRWLEENFSGERDYTDLPDEIELAPGVKIRIPKPDLTKLRVD